jgi:protein-S-isoprenylcysteine O-methyltransferase Ste14
MTSPQNVIGWAWAIALMVWIPGSLSNKRSVRKQQLQARAVQLALGVLVGLLIAGQGLFKGLGTAAVMPQTGLTSVIAVILTLGDIGFALGSRFALGRKWSANVTIKENHDLVRTGPYAIVRYPIYSGFLFALLGTTVARGTSGAFVGFGILVLLFCLKIRTEEQFMVEQFGSKYQAYRSQVKQLVPFLW